MNQFRDFLDPVSQLPLPKAETPKINKQYIKIKDKLVSYDHFEKPNIHQTVVNIFEHCKARADVTDSYQIT